MTDATMPHVPSESSPQPVPGRPGWVWWPGIAGLVYARRPGTSPPVVVRAHNFTALLARIRNKDGEAAVDIDLADLAAEFPSWDIGTVNRSEPPAGRNYTARRDGILLTARDPAGLRKAIRAEERPT